MPTKADNMAEKATVQTLWASFPPKTLAGHYGEKKHAEIKRKKFIGNLP